ncbi:MAG TPA: hypothetical protein VJX94_12375 [Stellaceae bacterium]|nr:hypothetical protein [Stellaceae bacterium]
MTKLDGTAEEDECRFDRGRYLRDAVAPSRWVNPLLGVLGALVLSGYLMTGHPSTSAASTDESTFSSMTDLLKAAFAAALALTWVVFGAWLGARRARGRNPLQGPAAYHSRTAYDSLRTPTCERMYDETRLVPQYLRSAEFPAMKQDLLRLAKVHPDEGLALRRIERVPDRCYSSLHDLITEICVD